jgi:amino acid adenylation domain-containing protein
MVVGILAILKVGGAYVPLDPNYPTSRLNYMVEDAQLSMILTQEKWQHHLSDTKASVICLDTDSEIINQQSQQRPENQVTANQLAYVIYTSGSTGQPKGVTIPHQGVVRLFSNTNYVQLDSTDRVAQVSNTSFDAATFEIWGALLHGAVVVVITKSVLLSPQEFVNYIKQEKITTLFLTTALFNQLAYSVPEAFSTLKYLLFGGEAVDTRSVKQVLEKGAPERLLHVYGPTENTTFSSWYKVTKVAEGATNLPIGKPISNTQIYILDSQLQPVPIGVSGELHIGGDGLAVGYHNRPELTASKFIPNPFENSQFKSSATPRRSQTQGNAHQEGQKSKLYKTGDLARYLGDGNIEFLGRIDHQVKIRGYRIETGEIEATLTQHPSVKQTVVVAREDNSGAQGLVAYIVPENESSLISNPELSNTQINSRQNLFNQQQESTQDASLIPQIRQFLKQKLPEYMIPAAFILLDAFPLTLNGKIDRRALPVPDTVPVALSTTYVMPITETEQLLAKIWQGVLQVEKVGIYDNFFELGGHSLLIIKVHTKLQEIYAQDISIVKLFQYPNISEFSKYLIDLETEKVTDTLTTGQAKARSDRKTSMKQQRLQRQQNRRNK